MAATAAALSAVSANCGWTARARWTKSWTAAYVSTACAVLRGRELQRRNDVLLLGAQAQRRATGDQHRQVGRGGQELRHHRRGADDLLKIVEQQQQMLVAQHARAAPPVARLPASSPKARAIAAGTSCRVVQWSEIDDHDTVDKRSAQRGGNREGQAGLADAAGADEGDEADVSAVQERRQRGNVLGAAEQRVGRRWQCHRERSSDGGRWCSAAYVGGKRRGNRHASGRKQQRARRAGERERVGKALGQLLGGLTGARLKLLDRRQRTPGAGGKLGLRQIHSSAPSAQCGAKR